MRLTLLSHFLNEEILLPHWVRHHREMFDHAILVDYGSTDSSLEIIKDMWPTAEVVKTSNNPLNIYHTDKEMMGLETTVDGWKVILNIPEFIVPWNGDLKSYIADFELTNPNIGFQTWGIWIQDRPEEINKPFTDESILLQRTFGYDDEVHAWGGNRARHRLVHKAPHGDYSGGRHSTHHQVNMVNNVFCVWFGLGLPEIKLKRNLSIAHTMSHRSDSLAGTGWQSHHRWDREMIYKLYNERAQYCSELTQHPIYGEALEHLRKRSG